MKVESRYALLTSESVHEFLHGCHSNESCLSFVLSFVSYNTIKV